MTSVKICGLKDSENLKAAIDAGADFVGLVFYPNSPRFIETADAAKLAKEIPSHIQSVGLFVNPTDVALEAILKNVKLNMIQLHGKETPARVGQIKRGLGLPVMKAIRVGTAADLTSIPAYELAADWLLLDAKVEGEHGGTGKSFDWNLLRDVKFKKPWMLSGGLNAKNVKAALNILKPTAVDVSSGVEKEKGVKDAGKIKDFIRVIKGAA